MSNFLPEMNKIQQLESDALARLEQMYKTKKQPEVRVAIEFLQLGITSQIYGWEERCREIEGIDPHMIAYQMLKFLGSTLAQFTINYGKGGKDIFEGAECLQQFNEVVFSEAAEAFARALVELHKSKKPGA